MTADDSKMSNMEASNNINHNFISIVKVMKVRICYEQLCIYQKLRKKGVKFKDVKRFRNISGICRHLKNLTPQPMF